MKTRNEKLTAGSFGQWRRFLVVVLFVAGNAIGASVLGLPIVMRSAGFVPACAACLLMSLVMAYAELLLARLFMESGASDLPGMFKTKLGPLGAALFNCSYFVLFFCLLVAYWAGTRAIFGAFSLGNAALWLTICAIACCLIFDFRAAGPINTLLTVGLLLSFACLGLKTFACHGGNLMETINFRAAAAALPIVICSYCFHGAIPLICHQLNCDRKMIGAAVICGIFFPLMFNLCILFVGFRVLSASDLAEGAANGWPLFVALANKLSAKSFFLLGNLFSIFAILSSLVGVTTTMKGAVADICGSRKKTSAFIEFAVILLLPLSVAIYCPKIFISTLEFSGGILSNLMVGILPLAALIRAKAMNWKYALLLALFVNIFCLELAKLIAH
ncbi:MAG: hypothetical protein LBI61_00480 [Puniceicoccales bacterium]|jgi:tyrosine-specific transport protein|nr:hypothetical protein [Puniceicoccales bacterium]